MGASHRWIFSDCWLPQRGVPEAPSHESLCILNTSDRSADITITLYYEDREPSTARGLSCPAQRTHHFRLDDLGDNPVAAVETNYSIVVESSVPVYAQYTRVDSRLPTLALMTTNGIAD
jgi:hypothetical protein